MTRTAYLLLVLLIGLEAATGISLLIQVPDCDALSPESAPTIATATNEDAPSGIIEAVESAPPSVTPVTIAKAPQRSLLPGLVGEYFWRKPPVEAFPDLPSDVEPTYRRIEENVNFEPVEGEFYGTGLVDNFYARFYGTIRIEKAGKYVFFTESDDGSQLLIDGKRVVDNQGLHGMEVEEGEAELAAGDHSIIIEYFENKGAAGCIASWQPADGSAEAAPIPPEVLFHAEDEKPPYVPRSTPDAVIDVAGMSIEEKVATVIPKPEEERWAGIPWRTNLMAARREAQLLGKPLFMWIMNGNPLGCT